jgi:hypothetical protein
MNLPDDLRDRESAGAVDADEQVQLASRGRHRCSIEAEEADRIALGASALWHVASNIRQTGDAAPPGGNDL